MICRYGYPAISLFNLAIAKLKRSLFDRTVTGAPQTKQALEVGVSLNPAPQLSHSAMCTPASSIVSCMQ